MPMAKKMSKGAMNSVDKVLQNKIKHNIWDHFDDVLEAIQTVFDRKSTYDWMWSRNTKCKYISIRLDMRDGGCILSDRKGNRISIDDLKYQYGKES